MGSRLSIFLAELKRRKVYRVAVVYAVLGVALIEGADLIFPRLLLPEWTVTLVVALVLLGFPAALALSWAFDVIPEGVKRATRVPLEEAQPEDAERAKFPDGAVREAVHEAEIFALPKGPVIAVLPFTNLSGNPDDEFFTDGITEDIITGLTRFTKLFVIARNSTFRFKGTAVDVQEVGRELGARYVLEGGIRRSARQLRVTAQLIDTRKRTHLWAETYDRDLTAGEVFAVQDEITDRVVATLAGAEGVLTRSGAREARAKPTDSLDAYEAVLRTFSYWDRQSPIEHLEVREALERAVEIDPEYGHAWACLSIVYLDEFRNGFNPRPDPLERALGAARKAVDLEPASHFSQHALAEVHFYRGELDAFFPVAQKAVQLNPNDCTVVAMTGLLTAYAGHWDRGLAMLEKAMALNPYHPGWYYFPLAFDHYRRGDYQRALEEAQRVEMPGYYPNHVVLAAIYGQLGREKDARAALENLLELFPRYGGRAREELGKWFRTGDMLEHVLDGLRKAGLAIPEA